MTRGAEEGAVGKMIVRGVEYAVRLHTDEPTKWNPQGSARFTTRVSGKDLYSETWEALYKLAMGASKEAAVKVNIPLLRLEWSAHSWSPPSSFRHVTMTGKHQKNGNFLIRYAVRDGKEVTEQIDRYHTRNDSFYLPMPVEAQAEGLNLMAAERKASDAVSKWKRAHEAALDKLYEVAEQEAMEKLDHEEGRGESAPVVKPTIRRATAKRRA